MLAWQLHATTRKTPHANINFEYGSEDISSRIFEILSCILHIFGIIYHVYTLRSADST